VAAGRPGGPSPPARHAEDRIRAIKDTGLTNLPLQAFDKNQIWLEIAQLAYELTVWTQPSPSTHSPPDPGTKRLRLRIFAVAGRLITSGRRRTLRISRRWPWAALITAGHTAIATYP